MLEIITLIFAILAFLTAFTVLLVFLIKKQKSMVEPVLIDLSELQNNQIRNSAEIKTTIENLEKNISLRMEGEMEAKLQAQSNALLKMMKEESEIDNKRLSDFQQVVNTNLNNQVKTMNETIDRRISDITSKTNEQMDAVRKSMKDLADADTKRLNDFQSTINSALLLQMKTMNERIDLSMKTINDRVNQSLNDGFKGTSESMVNLQKQLGMVEEAQKNINSLQNEITSLKDVLSNNQERGKYGEFQLELLLENLFEGSKGLLYDTQYVLEKAKGDEKELRPDAVIFLDGEAHHQIICIDSKFSLTGYEDLFDSNAHLSDEEIEKAKNAFKNATKLRIDETSKYIIKGKTISNAIMFIPNDGVFAYIHNEFPELIDYAKRKAVVLVSPTILQPLLASFRVIQIDAKKSKNIAKINEELNALGNEFRKFAPRWEALNNSIQGLVKKSGQFDTTVGKIGKRFDRVQKIDFEPEDGIDKEPIDAAGESIGMNEEEEE
ncbi:MAG TPA: hypothetical protein DCZ41_01650 [Firmicutes bacterium]|nr:hypothetical protein [Bacillota bacterium]